MFFFQVDRYLMHCTNNQNTNNNEEKKKEFNYWAFPLFVADDLNGNRVVFRRLDMFTFL